VQWVAGKTFDEVAESHRILLCSMTSPAGG
jgi:hypothetical protein